MHRFINVRFYWYSSNKISVTICQVLCCCLSSPSLTVGKKCNSLQLWHQSTHKDRESTGGDGGLVMHVWESLHSNIWPTAEGLHDWWVIFSTSAWGIMLSTQPITDQHTHPILNSLVWLRLGVGVGAGGVKHASTDHVRWEGVACAPTSSAATAHPKVEARASIFGRRGRRWTWSPRAPTSHLMRLRPPESCEHLWLWHWTDDRNIYGSQSWSYMNGKSHRWVALDISAH